jgi:DNA-binding response OmpR family regulator
MMKISIYDENNQRILNLLFEKGEYTQIHYDIDDSEDSRTTKESLESSGKFNDSLKQREYKIIMKKNVPDKLQLIGNYTFNIELRTLQWKEEEIQSITHKEYEILCLLLKNVNSLVSRERILTSFWEGVSYYTSRSLDLFIYHLRKKLKKDPCIEISTVRGEGYILKIKNNL